MYEKCNEETAKVRKDSDIWHTILSSYPYGDSEKVQILPDKKNLWFNLFWVSYPWIDQFLNPKAGNRDPINVRGYNIRSGGNTCLYTNICSGIRRSKVIGGVIAPIILFAQMWLSRNADEMGRSKCRVTIFVCYKNIKFSVYIGIL